MTKYNTIKYYKFALLFLGIFFFVTNCQKEEVFIEEPKRADGFFMKKVFYKDIESNGNLINILQKLERQNYKKESNNFAKTVYDSVNDFTVNTDEATYIEKEGYHSYTFLIERNVETNLTENLFLSLKNDGTYKVSIVQYTLGEGETTVNENTPINNIVLENYNTQDIIAEMTAKSMNCWITNINVIGTNGTEYDDVNDCLAVNGPGGCDTIIVHYGGGCPSVIVPPDGDNGGADNDNSNSDPNSTNADNVGDDNTGNNTTTASDTQTVGDPGSDVSNNGGENTDGTNDNGTDPTSANQDEDCILDANGNCIGGTTTLEPKKKKTVHKKNCEELAKLGSTTKIKQSYTNLQNKAANLSHKREYGYSFALNEDPKVAELSNNLIHLKPAFGGLVYGFSHTHPFELPGGEKVFPMYSIGDIYNLGKIAKDHYQPGVAKNYSLFVFTITVKSETGTETFAIKINDWSQFYPFLLSYSGKTTSERKILDRKLNRKYDQVYKFGGGNIANNYLAILFKFMNKENIDGIDIYKATDNNLLNWEKLTYNTTNNTVNDGIPCN